MSHKKKEGEEEPDKCSLEAEETRMEKRR